jgi:RAB protein geranylgeranyltransferase component A
MVQGGAKMSDVAQMLDSDSFVEIKKNLKKADRATEELQAAQQQAEQEMQQQQMEAAQMQQEAENLEREKDRQKDIEIALISAESKKDTEGHTLNLEKMIRDFEVKERELELRQRELDEKSRGNQAAEDISRETNQVKRDDSENRKEIADKNANKRS